MSWTSLCEISELREGKGHYVEIDGFQLAVFLYGESVYVMDNYCPHAGGNLAAGFVQDGCAVCPWHYWPFRLGKWIAERRGKWIFGFEDDLAEGRFRRLAASAGIQGAAFQAHNPIVGWWFLPYGRRITGLLGLNTPRWHAKRSRFGHALAMSARKPG